MGKSQRNDKKSWDPKTTESEQAKHLKRHFWKGISSSQFSWKKPTKKSIK